MKGKGIAIIGSGPPSIGAVVDCLLNQGLPVEVGDKLVATQSSLGVFDCLHPGMATDQPFLLNMRQQGKSNRSTVHALIGSLHGANHRAKY